MSLPFSGSVRQMGPLPELFLAIAILGFVGIGCSGPPADTTTPGLAIKHEVLPDPPHVGPATLTIRLSDATSAPITKARVSLETDMLHPGMATHPYEVKEVSPGVYESKVQFDMAGDWVVLLHIVLSSGNSFERQFDVKGVQPK
jgi:hypothetical protein